MNRLKYFVRSTLVIAAVIMGGCFGGRASKVADNLYPKYHAWNTITSVGEEDQGYSLYTYVILDGNTSTKTVEGRRNDALLNAIVNAAAIEGEAVRSPNVTTGILRQDCNIFLVPANQKILPQFASPLSLYNLPFAQRIVYGFARYVQGDDELMKRLAYGTGPFLVASPVPLQALEYRPAKILIADLSDTKPKLMPQVVAGFRQRQDVTVTDDIDRFRLIRLALMDEILPNKSLVIVKTRAISPTHQDNRGQY